MSFVTDACPRCGQLGGRSVTHVCMTAGRVSGPPAVWGTVGDAGAALAALTQERDDARGRVAVLEAALRDADDLLRRLSEWDVLNLAPGSGDDGPYWQREIAKARAVLAGGEAA